MDGLTLKGLKVLETFSNQWLTLSKRHKLSSEYKTVFYHIRGFERMSILEAEFSDLDYCLKKNFREKICAGK